MNSKDNKPDQHQVSNETRAQTTAPATGQDAKPFQTTYQNITPQRREWIDHIKKNIGRPKSLTPDQLRDHIVGFVEMCETEQQLIEIPKANMKTGEVIKLNKPKPPLIESFCIYAGISIEVFRRMTKEVGYEAYHSHAREMVNYCITKVLEYMHLGIISEATAKFYLINNSIYKDVSSIEIDITDKNKPAWLSTQKAEQKQIPGESIDYEDVE